MANNGPCWFIFLKNPSSKGWVFQFANWTRHYQRILNKKRRFTDSLRLLCSEFQADCCVVALQHQLAAAGPYHSEHCQGQGHRVGWETRSAFQMRAVQSWRKSQVIQWFPCPVGLPGWGTKLVKYCSHIFYHLFKAMFKVVQLYLGGCDNRWADLCSQHGVVLAQLTKQKAHAIHISRCWDHFGSIATAASQVAKLASTPASKRVSSGGSLGHWWVNTSKSADPSAAEAEMRKALSQFLGSIREKSQAPNVKLG